MCPGPQRTLGGFTASAAKGNKKASSTVAGNSDWGLLWGAMGCWLLRRYDLQLATTEERTERVQIASTSLVYSFRFLIFTWSFCHFAALITLVLSICHGIVPNKE